MTVSDTLNIEIQVDRASECVQILILKCPILDPVIQPLKSGLIVEKHIHIVQRVFFSRTPLRTPPGVRSGSTYGVRNK